MLQPKKVAWCILLSIIFSFATKAQSEQENSPYSFFGPGDLKNTALPERKAMGGVGIASSSVQSVNLSNPAALGNMRFATLHTGIFANGHWLRNNQSSSDQTYINNSFNASMDYLIIGLPITKWWGSSIGLVPYASTSYDLNRISTNPNLPDSLNTEAFNFRGEGAFYLFQWGNGFSNLIDTLINPILIFPQDLRETESFRLNDFGFHSGIQYQKLFYKNISADKEVVQEEIDRILTFGVSFKSKTNLNAKRDYALESVLFDPAGNLGVVDTIGEFSDSANATMVLPLTYGIGINYKKPGIWEVEANYERIHWSNYRDGRINSLADAFKVSAGISVKPINRSNLGSNRFTALNYYVGGYYYSNHIRVQGETTPDFGLTLGFGVPLYNNLKFKRLAKVNVSLNIGNRGNTLENQVRETYFKANFGFTFNDGNWFIKRKYD